MLMNQPPLIERAFELARSGTFQSVSDIEAALTADGYASVQSHLAGPALRRDLRQLCLEARRARRD